MGSLEITKNIDIKNYNMKYMSNESTAAGTMLYIANLPTYKRTIDLNFYKTNELESTLTELLNLKKKTECFN